MCLRQILNKRLEQSKIMPKNLEAKFEISFIVKDQVKITGEVHITISVKNLNIDTEKLMENFKDDFQEIYEIICWTKFPNEK